MSSIRGHWLGVRDNCHQRSEMLIIQQSGNG